MVRAGAFGFSPSRSSTMTALAAVPGRDASAAGAFRVVVHPDTVRGIAVVH
jgi:hypothetical protein